ncbi:MAG TPA: LON peptidase substrate-binding domain-containing protein, partial [candidate division Zixibacteria bacterium]|nr:LON peptidase substrate-binding domain-containing protein [candidate division Zixibacteria bacterium]
MSTFKIVHNGELVTVNSRLCVIPLRDVVVFPHMIYPLLIGREFTVKALREAMEGDRQVLLLAQKVAGVDNPGQEDLYDVGLGVTQDSTEAVRWYRAAAEAGMARAQNNLGIMYADGVGVPQDYEEAVKWYRLSADQGLPEGQNSMGYSYELG